MYAKNLPALALLALSHFSVEVAANYGWWTSCNSGILEPPTSDPYADSECWHLFADCKIHPNEADSEYTLDASLNIGSCFGVSDGQLVTELE
jgi:hypothetical protein